MSTVAINCYGVLRQQPSFLAALKAQLLAAKLDKSPRRPQRWREPRTL